MKARRHFAIIDILGKQRIETQAELSAALKLQGFKVTQATVSRDIKDLCLIKLPDSQGYRYVLPEAAGASSSAERLKRAFQDSVVCCDSSENIIMIKTLPGSAQSIGARVDSMSHPSILGSVAGDDTILVVVKPIGAVADVLRLFRELIMA
ncbi:MAG: arginine repressor [Syntrophomonadaceae bacterium]|nr:arginine repressor [Syntrophomonadaceae bacterium]